MKPIIAIALLAIGIAQASADPLADPALLTSSVLEVVGSTPITIGPPSQGSRRITADGQVGEIRATSTGFSIKWNGRITTVLSSRRPTNVTRAGNRLEIRIGPKLFFAVPSGGGWQIRTPTSREQGLGG